MDGGGRREDADGGWRMENGVILYFPVASIVFGDMVIVSLFLLLVFLANLRSCLERYRLAHIFGPAGYCVILIVRKARLMTLMTIRVCGH